MHRVYHLKSNPTTITYQKSEAGPPRCNRLLTLESRSSLLLGRCSRQVRKSCAGTNFHEHFFMWGFLRETVYSNNPRNFEDLKHNIAQTVANINSETLRRFARNTLKRAHACLREVGEHFQHLLWRFSVSSFLQIKIARLSCYIGVTKT
jgi:hypothetical protein